MSTHDTTLATFLSQGIKAFAKGPVALILAEDAVEIASTLRHCLDAGFRAVALFAPPDLEVPPQSDPRIHLVRADVLAEGSLTTIVNACLARIPKGTWVYYGYNAEYLFYPFFEHRSVAELATFITEERRASALAYVIDLYADDLVRFPQAVSISSAFLDRSGYYALARKGPDNNPLERQLDFFGGLRWRFEEHVPPPRRRIDRISFFANTPGLALRADHTFNIAEYNTYACPWHNSPTTAVCSFRTAKALKRNPGSSAAIDSFMWHNSTAFEWHSRQLLNLGLMEPGQWF